MQDNITVSKDHLRWMLSWQLTLKIQGWKTPMIISGRRGGKYQYHDWFWLPIQRGAVNDNVPKKA